MERLVAQLLLHAVVLAEAPPRGSRMSRTACCRLIERGTSPGGWRRGEGRDPFSSRRRTVTSPSGCRARSRYASIACGRRVCGRRTALWSRARCDHERPSGRARSTHGLHRIRPRLTTLRSTPPRSSVEQHDLGVVGREHRPGSDEQLADRYRGAPVRPVSRASTDRGSWTCSWRLTFEPYARKARTQSTPGRRATRACPRVRPRVARRRQARGLRSRGCGEADPRFEAVGAAASPPPRARSVTVTSTMLRSANVADRRRARPTTRASRADRRARATARNATSCDGRLVKPELADVERDLDRTLPPNDDECETDAAREPEHELAGCREKQARDDRELAQREACVSLRKSRWTGYASARKNAIPATPTTGRAAGQGSARGQPAPSHRASERSRQGRRSTPIQARSSPAQPQQSEAHDDPTTSCRNSCCPTTSSPTSSSPTRSCPTRSCPTRSCPTRSFPTTSSPTSYPRSCPIPTSCCRSRSRRTTSFPLASAVARAESTTCRRCPARREDDAVTGQVILAA